VLDGLLATHIRRLVERPEMGNICYCKIVVS